MVWDHHQQLAKKAEMQGNGHALELTQRSTASTFATITSRPTVITVPMRTLTSVQSGMVAPQVTASLAETATFTPVVTTLAVEPAATVHQQMTLPPVEML